MTGPQKRKARDKHRLQLGLCIQCGVRPLGDERRYCLRCRTMRRAADRLYRQTQRTRLKQAGFCTTCGVEPVRDYTRCNACRARMSRLSTAYNHRRRVPCKDCGQPAAHNSRSGWCKCCAAKHISVPRMNAVRAAKGQKCQ